MTIYGILQKVLVNNAFYEIIGGNYLNDVRNKCGVASRRGFPLCFRY